MFIALQSHKPKCRRSKTAISITLQCHKYACALWDLHILTIGRVHRLQAPTHCLSPGSCRPSPPWPAAPPPVRGWCRDDTTQPWPWLSVGSVAQVREILQEGWQSSHSKNQMQSDLPSELSHDHHPRATILLLSPPLSAGSHILLCWGRKAPPGLTVHAPRHQTVFLSTFLWRCPPDKQSFQVSAARCCTRVGVLRQQTQIIITAVWGTDEEVGGGGTVWINVPLLWQRRRL